MARNALGLILLAAVTLSGCSSLDNLPFVGNKKAKEAEVRAAALRLRTDSLRKARRTADSLAQVQFAACVDSVRAELVKPPRVVKKSKARSRKAALRPPSEELIAAQAQSACGQDAHAPMPSVAADSGSLTAKTSVAAANTPAPKPAATDSSRAPAAVADPAPVASMAPVIDQAAIADSVQKAKETEMSRETFAYSGSTRDPFNSLLNMAKTGPEVADLLLVGIYQNMRSPSGNVAVFREKEGGKRHKLRAGDQLGRSRVVQIRERDVVFMIEDFGFERQETLSLRKQEDVTP